MLGRATEMFRWQQLAAPGGRAAARRGLDGLLADARSHRSSSLVTPLLGIGIGLRVHGGRRADVAETETLLAEFRERAEGADDCLLRGEAATLRAHHNAVFSTGENPIHAAAEALAVLTDLVEAGPNDDRADWAASLSRSLNGLVLVLLALGAHEIAHEVSQQAITVSNLTGSALDRLIHRLNRVRLQLSWALRLERGGREAAATGRLVGAVQAARDASRLWAPAFGRNWSDGLPAVQECPIIAAAYALHRPGPSHLDTLDRLARTAHYSDDRILLAIATARCLLADDRPAAAVSALAPLRDELDHGSSEVALTLALHREFALADAAVQHAADPTGPRPGGDALGRYAAALEAELWALHEAGISALRSHCENHRLSREHGALAREHGAVTAQLLEDPLTGLPNRRALDLRLAEATSEANQPCAVALVDLDRFKDVNDGRSHAVGDVVLREIAATVRRTRAVPGRGGPLRRRRVRGDHAVDPAAGGGRGAHPGHQGGRRAAARGRLRGHDVGRRGQRGAGRGARGHPGRRGRRHVPGQARGRQPGDQRAGPAGRAAPAGRVRRGPGAARRREPARCPASPSRRSGRVPTPAPSPSGAVAD